MTDEALFEGIRYVLCDTAAFGQKQNEREMKSMLISGKDHVLREL